MIGTEQVHVHVNQARNYGRPFTADDDSRILQPRVSSTDPLNSVTDNAHRGTLQNRSIPNNYAGIGNEQIERNVITRCMRYG
jgi:hypothetical protein